MTFTERMSAGVTHEQRVADALRSRGWIVHEIGQGQIPEDMRDALRAVTPPTPLRWWPDLIAARNLGGRWQTVLVDAKSGREDTPNHAVERAALDAHLEFEWSFNLPVYYVFADGLCASPDDVRELAEHGEFRGRGSSTPFVLISKTFCRTFESTFGPITAAPDP